MIKYRTSKFYFERNIEEIEISRETDKSVWIKTKFGEQREAKKTNYYRYFDTWEEAHQHLLSEAEKDIMNAERRLENAKHKLMSIKEMKR